MLVCPMWELQSNKLKAKVGINISWHVILTRMLQDSDIWKEVNVFARSVICEKERLERERQAIHVPVRHDSTSPDSDESLALSS